MKKYIPLFSLVFILNMAFGQVNVQPAEKVNTGYLYELSPALSEIEKYDGTENASPANIHIWNQLYFEIAKSNLTLRDFRSIQSIHQNAKEMMRSGVIPIGMLAFDYNRIRGNPADYLTDENTLNLQDARLTEHTLFAAASFRNEIYHGNQVTFSLDEDFIFSDSENLPRNFRVNFNDGSGWQEVVLGDEISVSYNTLGEKTIAIQTDEQGEKRFGYFTIKIKRLQAPPPTATWLVEADQGYNGVTTTGDAFVLLSDQNTQLTRPVVVCEGIDFEDTFGWDALYDLFNQQNMLEELRAQGLDIVVLNFHQPLTYIQSNAFLFKKLLEMVNDSIDFSRPLQIVGPSMGGMVTRYALTHLENEGIEHNCNLWISFDAPHTGANIPLGVQYAVFFFKDLDANVQMLLDILDGPAAREMLAYHYTDPVSSPATHDPLFDTFQNELAGLGDYPQTPRKVALSNGRGDGVGLPYSAGDQAIEYEYNSFLFDVVGNMWTVKDNAAGLVFEGLIDPLIGATEQLNANVFSPKPYDNCPGGMRSTFAQMGELELPFGELIVLHENHAFIPTISALEIDTEDLFYNISADPDIMSLTPFDTIFWSADNYDHTFISPETAQFAISEIMSAQPQTQQIMLTAGWNDLSSYVDPADKNIEALASQLGDELIILQNNSGIFWPAGSINTLNEWNYKNGYLVKVISENEFTVSGSIPEDKSVQINQGWNLIPVLCKDCPDIGTILGTDLSKVKIIREAVGVNIFWPEVGIYSLTHFVPGNAYYLYANEPFLLNFE